MGDNNGSNSLSGGGLGASESPLGSPGQGSGSGSGNGGGVVGGPVGNGGSAGSFQATPAPASLTLMGTGLFGLLTYGYARRRAARRIGAQS